jgi:hypothetical protein
VEVSSSSDASLCATEYVMVHGQLLGKKGFFYVFPNYVCESYPSWFSYHRICRKQTKLYMVKNDKWLKLKCEKRMKFLKVMVMSGVEDAVVVITTSLN